MPPSSIWQPQHLDAAHRFAEFVSSDAQPDEIGRVDGLGVLFEAVAGSDQPGHMRHQLIQLLGEEVDVTSYERATRLALLHAHPILAASRPKWDEGMVVAVANHGPRTNHLQTHHYGDDLSLYWFTANGVLRLHTASSEAIETFWAEPFTENQIAAREGLMSLWNELQQRHRLASSIMQSLDSRIQPPTEVDANLELIRNLLTYTGDRIPQPYYAAHYEFGHEGPLLVAMALLYHIWPRVDPIRNVFTRKFAAEAAKMRRLTALLGVKMPAVPMP